MKAQCERCKEIVGLEFALADGGIEVTCPGCGARYFVRAAEKADPEKAPEKANREQGTGNREQGTSGSKAAGFSCPKCAEAQPEAAACRRCGLVFARWTGSGASGLGGDDRAAELFAACEADWGDPARHERFVAVCQQTGGLAYAAGRYRARGDDAVAVERLKQIRTLAEATLARTLPSAPDREVAPYKNVKALMIFIIVLLAGGAVWATFFRPTPREQGPGEGDVQVPIVPLPPTKALPAAGSSDASGAR